MTDSFAIHLWGSAVRTRLSLVLAFVLAFALSFASLASFATFARLGRGVLL